jgi:hypothetical protein
MQKTGIICHRCVCETWYSIIVEAKRNNARMTETGWGKGVKYNEMDLLILDILRKDNPSVEGLNCGDCFQAEEALVDQQQAKLPTSVLLADMPSPSTVRDENRNTYTGLRHAIHITH